MLFMNPYHVDVKYQHVVPSNVFVWYYDFSCIYSLHIVTYWIVFLSVFFVSEIIQLLSYFSEFTVLMLRVILNSHSGTSPGCCIMQVWAFLFILPVFSHTVMNLILILSWMKISWSYFFCTKYLINDTCSDSGEITFLCRFLIKHCLYDLWSKSTMWQNLVCDSIWPRFRILCVISYQNFELDLNFLW